VCDEVHTRLSYTMSTTSRAHALRCATMFLLEPLPPYQPDCKKSRERAQDFKANQCVMQISVLSFFFFLMTFPSREGTPADTSVLPNH
jgi:hypothetical protein